MNGVYNIVAKGPKMEYNFTLKRKITIITGDSGTGKSTLYDIVRFATTSVAGFMVNSSRPCVTLTERYWESELRELNNSIIFLDESEDGKKSFVGSKLFAELVNKSSNYFVIIGRKNFDMLSYSMDEIYNVHSSGKYHNLVLQEYPHRVIEIFQPTIIIVEDSNAGFDFYRQIPDVVPCHSAKGKSNIIEKLKSLKLRNEYILIICDAANFGTHINRLQEYMISDKNNVYLLFAPESFEYLLLSCQMFDNMFRGRRDLTNPEEFIKDEQASWEIYFEDLLKKTLPREVHGYNKNESLNRCFSSNCCFRGERCLLYVPGIKHEIVLARYGKHILLQNKSNNETQTLIEDSDVSDNLDEERNSNNHPEAFSFNEEKPQFDGTYDGQLSDREEWIWYSAIGWETYNSHQQERLI